MALTGSSRRLTCCSLTAAGAPSGGTRGHAGRECERATTDKHKGAGILPVAVAILRLVDGWILNRVVPYDLGAAVLTTSATRGVTVDVDVGNGQPVASGATVEFRLAVTRAAASLAGKRAVISLELDTDVLTDVPGEIELRFA